MIRTKDLVNFMNIRVGQTFRYEEIDKEMVLEIVARLRAYDKLKERIEKLIATMSNVVDTGKAPNPVCQRCKYWVNMPIGCCTLDDECPENPYKRK